MKLESLAFLFHEGVLNIRRHGLMSLAALGTVAISLTVLGGTAWTAYRVNEIAQRQPQRFNEIDVFLHPEAAREQTLEVQQRISALPEVSGVHLTTREEAWRLLQHREPTLTQAMPENPLMDKLEVQVRESSRVGGVAAALRSTKTYPEVMQVNDANAEVRMLLAFARFIKVIGGSITVGLLIATLFIVQNTIRLTVFARRREIRIMQLVGASPGFIRFPLLFEGVFHGLIGGGIAGGVLWFCSREVSRFVTMLHSPLIGDLPSRIGPVDVLGGLIGIGVLIGLIGSYLSLHRYLRQP